MVEGREAAAGVQQRGGLHGEAPEQRTPTRVNKGRADNTAEKTEPLVWGQRTRWVEPITIILLSTFSTGQLH